MHSYSDPLTHLIGLGKFETDDWLDYSTKGINSNHIDELLRMAADSNLLTEDSDAWWAPLHAVYALYPLIESKQEAIPSLLEQIKCLFEDVEDCEEEDFLWIYIKPVILKFGHKAWEPLVAIFNHVDISLSSKVTFVDAMTSLVEQWSEQSPDYRDQLIQLLCKAMDDTSADDPEDNAGLLGSLCDLKATEAIESIRAAFERNAIDLTYMGDVEDVEIDLGLRTERATPERDYLAEEFPWIKELREELQHLSEDERLKLMSELFDSNEPEDDFEDYEIVPDNTPLVLGPKIGRNDPCPCGSGKKFKKCCMD